MRKILLAGLCLFFSGHAVVAQNKTLGVGVAVPNPNAALHVESPTGNQGFIMPRMTTAQRFAPAFKSVLSPTDKGLMVFDTDLNTIFIWNGSGWQNTGQVSGGVKLTYPYVDSVTTATGTNDLVAFKYNAGEPKRILRIENHSAANGSSALSVYNAGTGLGAYLQVANAASTSSTLYATTNSDAGGDLAPVAVYGESTGIGSLGGSFRTQNAANPHPALFAESKGTGNAIMAMTSGTGGAGKFMVNNANSVMPALWAETNSSQPLSAAIYGLNTGTGDAAGVFRINNGASTFPAVVAETNGTGRAALFRKTGTTGSQPAVFVDSQGGHGIWADHNGATGYAAIIQTINTTNPNSAMFVESIGTGPSMWIQKSPSAAGGDALVAENNVASGGAAIFKITDAANPSPVVNAMTSGAGAAIRAENSGAGNGFAGNFEVTNATNTFPAIQASTAGTGSGVRVMQSVGFGAGMDIFMQNTASEAPGLAVDHQGVGTAGSFLINNATSPAPAIYAATNALGGNAMRVANDADGIAFTIWKGGMTITTMDVTTATIPSRASAFRLLSGGTTFTLGFTPVVGEVFMIYNETGQMINFNASGITHTLLDGEGKTFVVFAGGQVRGF